MNGPIQMYTTSQLVSHDFPVELPTCMYKVKNIHVPKNGMVGQPPADRPSKILDISNKKKESVAEMTKLEMRQKQILEQLSELKKQMKSIRSRLNLKTENVVEPHLPVNIKCDHVLVINASPTHPPYSLELLQKWCRDDVHLKFITHLHSSVATLPPHAATLSKNLENASPMPGIKAELFVRLIWKNVGPDMELKISNAPICGEVNILRYFSRLNLNNWDYEALPKPHEIDRLLDVSYLLTRTNNFSKRSVLLQTLSKSLGKDKWLAGRSNITILDLAAYSAIKQVAEKKEVDVNLNKWLTRCEQSNK